jgi:hypothetical protein
VVASHRETEPGTAGTEWRGRQFRQKAALLRHGEVATTIYSAPALGLIMGFQESQLSESQQAHEAWIVQPHFSDMEEITHPGSQGKSVVGRI